MGGLQLLELQEAFEASLVFPRKGEAAKRRMWPEFRCSSEPAERMWSKERPKLRPWGRLQLLQVMGAGGVQAAAL